MIRVLFTLLSLRAAGERVGHMRPIGEQRLPEGHVEVRTDIPDVREFFEGYVSSSKPVVLKGAANNIPAYKLWTDQYLKEKYGDVICGVEEGKKENRSLDLWTWRLDEFINRYKSADVYMVNTLTGNMLGDLRLFPFMSCGGLSKVVIEAIMWFSSGGTKSVLHHDRVDNINCLFSGSKRLYMSHWENAKHLVFDANDRSHSLVDVDSVDLDVYPGIAEAPWWQANMEAGDCLFIPSRWYHQVRSFAVHQRNLAVNTWFYHLFSLNYTDCHDNEFAGSYVPLDEVKYCDVEGVRLLLGLEVQDKALGKRGMAKALLRHFGDLHKNHMLIKRMLKILDKNGDNMFTLEEVQSLTDGELQRLKTFFPGFDQHGADDDTLIDGDGVDSGDEIHSNGKQNDFMNVEL